MIICADDFGMSEDIDRAILELCARKKISAVSCMANVKRCERDAFKLLLEHQSNVDIGLHLCFADETLADLENKKSLPAFGNIFRKSLLGQIRAKEIFSDISAQYELFVKKCGRAPDYLDGHLHAHQLPGVREGLIEFVSTLPPENRPYVRNTYEPLKNLWQNKLPWLKAAFIGNFGAKMLAELHAAGVPTNDGFAGIYDFKNYRRYAEYFPRFAACLKKANGILVVHPGENENWRRAEVECLGKNDFTNGSPNRFQREK